MGTTELNERTMKAIRKCGHYLHHNAGPASGLSTDQLLTPLTDEEKETLASLLEKCLNSWNEGN